MANQSLVSVPPNVENPRVLQRFLTRLVEQLDVVLGNRANEGYVSQEELVAQAQSLTETIVAAEQQLQTVLDRLENTTEIDIENLNNRISSLESTTASQGDTLDVLENVTPVKIVTLSFTANGLGDPVLLLDYNIATSSKVGVGLYEFTINQSVFNGANALDNSVISTYYNMVSSTDLFIIEYTTINATTFRIQVIEQTAGAYDITVNDVVDVMAFMDIPGTFLPPEF